jgi:hypothetical protein
VASASPRPVFADSPTVGGSSAAAVGEGPSERELMEIFEEVEA